MPVFFNLLYNPIEYSVQILPSEVKNIICERLKTQVKTTYKTDEILTKTINTLITYLDYEEAGDFNNSPVADEATRVIKTVDSLPIKIIYPDRELTLQSGRN